MDTRLRTSFVPKKTLVSRSTAQGGGSVINPFLSLGIIIFFMSAALTGGAYLYKALIQKQIASNKADLVKARESFEEKTIIEWKRRDNRLKVAAELLNLHKVISPIFTTLEATTLRTTRFMNFNFTSADDGSLFIKMKGEGLSYTSVALLSDSFNAQKKIKDPVFSDLSLSDKGGVNFLFTGSLDPSLVSYKETFNQTEETSF
ncbi:MAG: hypothetical protein WCT49_03870 [Candidatus Paceibacterota bacterium]|jgi:hypothetical protein|nr:hypothetical protein [Candidatus Paceibacterota bacterium]